MSLFKDGINVFGSVYDSKASILTRPVDHIKENVDDIHNVEKIRKVEDNLNEVYDYMKDHPTKSSNHFEDKTVYTKKDRPQPIWRKLKELLIAERVQRPFDDEWAWKIASMWNPCKANAIVVLKIKVIIKKDGFRDKVEWLLYICDGQHTASALAIRSYYGFEEGFGPDNWGENEILTTELECESLAVAREVFLSLNLSKKKLDEYDIWSIQCMGKKIDYKDTICEDHPEWETAGEFYDVMSKYGIRPVSKSSADKILPGALSDISKFMKGGKNPGVDWDKDDYDFVFAMHKLNFDYLPTNSFEYDPWISLKNNVSGETDFNKDSETKQFYQDLGSVIRTFTEIPAGWITFATETWNVFLETHQSVKQSIPPNMSMLLLLECYEKAGGTFTKKRVNMKALKDTVYENMIVEKNLVDCIGKDKISMLENTAKSNTDVK